MRDGSSFHKGSRGSMSSLALEMQQIVRGAAEPVSAGDTVKGQMRKAWEALGRPSYWRLRAAWYGEASGWSARAVEDMRHRAERRRRKEAKGRAEAIELAGLFQSIAGRLAEVDPDFHREDIAALERATGALGVVGRPVARTEPASD